MGTLKHLSADISAKILLAHRAEPREEGPATLGQARQGILSWCEHTLNRLDSKFAQLPSFLERRDQKYDRAGDGPSPIPNESARKSVLISTEGEMDKRTVIKTGTGSRSHNQRAVAF